MESNHALSRALDSLLSQGIDSPTPEQWRHAIKTAPSAPFTQSDAPLSGYIPQALQAISERLHATLSQDKGHTAMPKATISHTGSKKWNDCEYLIDAPEGYRFEGMDCHQLVVAYGYEDMTRKQAYQDALEERRTHPLEKCPNDCLCKE